MPRVENVGPNVDEWHDKADGEGSSTFDVCKRCAGHLKLDPHAFDKELAPFGVREPEGDEGRAGELDHPDYDDEDYKCGVCERRLTGADD
jgi:hypothetical protein